MKNTLRSKDLLNYMQDEISPRMTPSPGLGQNKVLKVTGKGPMMR
jgi:hypothetical protein